MSAARSPRTLTVYVALVASAGAIGAEAIWGMPKISFPAWSVLAILPAMVGAWVLGEALGRRGAEEPVGLADRVTVLRAALVGLLAGWSVLLWAGSVPALSWWLTGIAALALALDGVDGAVARARGSATVAGARLDAETDAVMVAVLSVIVAYDVGLWILLAGGLRYAFAFTWRLRWDWTTRAQVDLPHRASRRVVAAVSAAALVTATVPVMPATLVWALALMALALLLVSFGSDALWLEAGRGRGVISDVVGRSPLQGGIDATDILPENAQTQQLHGTDRSHDDDG